MAETASAFTIRELTGDKRTFRFTGRGLPYPPFTLSGSQRHDITWYPGSPEGVIQVLGAKEDESTLNGAWKDRFLKQVSGMSPAEQVAAGFADPNGLLQPFNEQAAGQQGTPGALIDGEPIANVRELAAAIDDVRRKGQIVEVTWVSQKRQGLLSSFRQSWLLATDLDWEMRFTWSNQGVQIADIPIQDRSADLSDLVIELETQLDVIFELGEDAASQPALKTDTNVNLIDQIHQSLEQLQDVIVVSTQDILAPIGTAQRAIGILDFMKDIGESTANAIERRLDAAILNIDATFGTKLDRRNTLTKQRRAARRISTTAAIRKEQMEQQVKPELISAYNAREDQDLRDVALEFYGIADEWRSLMVFNNLDTSRLAANQLIFVPRNPPRGDQC